MEKEQYIIEKLDKVSEDVNYIKGKFETYPQVSQTVSDNETRSKSNEQRIDKIEDNHKWLYRTIAGTVIVAVIGGIMTVASFVKNL